MTSRHWPKNWRQNPQEDLRPEEAERMKNQKLKILDLFLIFSRDKIIGTSFEIIVLNISDTE